MFEPDRISATNLQTAYEQILPTKQYRIVLPQRLDELLEIGQAGKERAGV